MKIEGNTVTIEGIYTQNVNVDRDIIEFTEPSGTVVKIPNLVFAQLLSYLTDDFVSAVNEDREPDEHPFLFDGVTVGDMIAVLIADRSR